jgi:hypothetical protein
LLARNENAALTGAIYCKVVEVAQRKIAINSFNLYPAVYLIKFNGRNVIDYNDVMIYYGFSKVKLPLCLSN